MIWVACALNWGHVVVQKRSSPKNMSGSLALQQPGSELMSMAPLTTNDLGDAVQGLLWCWGHTDLGSLCCHLGPWRSPGMECCLWHVWVHSFAAAGVWDKVHGFCYYQVLCRCTASSQTSETMLLSGGFDDTRAMLIWVPYAAIGNLELAYWFIIYLYILVRWEKISVFRPLDLECCLPLL